MCVPLEWQSPPVLPWAVPSAAALPTSQEGRQLLHLGVPVSLVSSGEELAGHGLCP